MAMNRRHADGDLDVATGREPPLGHADSDLDMTIGREPPLRHVDSDLNIAMENNYT